MNKYLIIIAAAFCLVFWGPSASVYGITANELREEQQAAACQEGCRIEGGIVIVGAELLMEDGILSRPETGKTPGELDWELRGEALKGYGNLGLTEDMESYVNVRDKAGTDGKIVGKLLGNSAVDILGTSDDGDWYQIRSGSVEGYAAAEYIITGQEARDRGREIANLQVIINTETLNVRSEASERAPIWTQADGDESFDVVNQDDEWVEIELDSDTGFVSREYVKVVYRLDTAVPLTSEEEAETEETSLRDRVVNYSLKWLGCRYVWGGESLGKGVDCSGFTKEVYEHFGYSLSHYTGSQAHEGKKVSRSQLKKGDLVFYAKNGSINHVMLYIGDGQVVGARSKRRGVCVADLDYRTPVRYVRIIDD